MFNFHVILYMFYYFKKKPKKINTIFSNWWFKIKNIPGAIAIQAPLRPDVAQRHKCVRANETRWRFDFLWRYCVFALPNTQYHTPEFTRKWRSGQQIKKPTFIARTKWMSAASDVIFQKLFNIGINQLNINIQLVIPIKKHCISRNIKKATFVGNNSFLLEHQSYIMTNWNKILFATWIL